MRAALDDLVARLGGFGQVVLALGRVDQVVDVSSLPKHAGIFSRLGAQMRQDLGASVRRSHARTAAPRSDVLCARRVRATRTQREQSAWLARLVGDACRAHVAFFADLTRL